MARALKNVMLIGGIYHPFDEYAHEIAKLGDANGMETVATDSIDEAIELLPSADFLTLYALRWRMLNHEKYIPHRPRWAYETSSELVRALEQHAASGRPVLAMHTASICFDDWPGYANLLGGRWVWDQSFHPEAGAVHVEALGHHECTRGIEPFTVEDEVYHNLEMLPGSTPLLRARHIGGAWQTVSWAHHAGPARVIYNALGHDGASLRQPGHRAFLSQALRWLLAQ